MTDPGLLESLFWLLENVASVRLARDAHAQNIHRIHKRAFLSVKSDFFCLSHPHAKGYLGRKVDFQRHDLLVTSAFEAIQAETGIPGDLLSLRPFPYVPGKVFTSSAGNNRFLTFRIARAMRWEVLRG